MSLKSKLAKTENAEKGVPYRLRGCGLDNIFLLNGFTFRTTPYGDTVSFDDLNGLHKAIALHLVNHKPRLNGDEFRFLRAEMEMSQKKLGSLMGVTEQAIALWEKGKVPVQGYGDILIRGIYKEFIGGNADLIRLSESFRQLDVEGNSDLYFQKTKRGWDCIPGAAGTFSRIAKLTRKEGRRKSAESLV